MALNTKLAFSHQKKPKTLKTAIIMTVIVPVVSTRRNVRFAVNFIEYVSLYEDSFIIYSFFSPLDPL